MRTTRTVVRSTTPLGSALYAALLPLFFLLVVPLSASAAELTFTPSSGTFSVGQEITARVTINPGTDSVNAADGTVSFNKDVLSVTSVSKDGSVFSLWTADPTFSNTAGTVSFSGGTPSAFSRSGTVVTIKFKALKVGVGTVSMQTGSVLAADGKGTNVYTKGADASYTIEAAAAPPPPPPKEEVPEEDVPTEAFGGSPPIAPVVTSPTHGKPDSWYSTSTVIIQWKIPPDVVGIRTLFSTKENEKPTATIKSTEVSQTFLNVPDGTHYFYIQFRNEAGWGEVGVRKVLIDSVQPLTFDVSLVEADDGPKLKFQAIDELSGVDRYEVQIGTSTSFTVKDSDLVNGMYPVPPQGGGSQIVSIKAIDKAGNLREASKELALPVVAKPKPKGAPEEEEVPSVFTPERILLIIFAFIIGVIGTINVQRGRVAQSARRRILEEVAEMRDRNDKIFTAMREEFEQMVQDLDAKPQLTPVERDLLEKIKEVLEVSEEIVDTGMDHLKKTIRE